MMLKKLLDMIACPDEQCRKPLTLTDDEQSLQCTGCKRVYPIKDDIPMLLLDANGQPPHNGSC